MTGQRQKFSFSRHLRHGDGSVAAALRERGFTVTGSDENVYPPMSTFLEKRGITLKRLSRGEYSAERGRDRGRQRDQARQSRSRSGSQSKALLLSLPEVLKKFFPARPPQSRRHRHARQDDHDRAAHLDYGKRRTANPGYMIGGIPKNLGQGARLNDSKHFVIEGDEYDTAFFDKRSKFVHYLPELVIVNNIEFDHADIFRDLDEIKLSFRRLLNIVPQNGMVLLNGDDPNCVDVAKDCLAQMVEVGFSENCAQHIRDVAYSAHGSRFTLGDDEFEIPLVGEFNVRNAAMAIYAARFYGVPDAKIREALEEFHRHRAPAGSARRSARRHK